LDTKLTSEQKIIKRISKMLSPGSIVLLHDTSEKTVSVLEQLLVILRNKNYSAVTIEQLLKINAYEK
jgi:peptidoglycan/xylan/chitin deacetylase (PgdA/CDA1 family)